MKTKTAKPEPYVRVARIAFSFVYVFLATLTVALFWVAFSDVPTSRPAFDVWAFIFVLAAQVAEQTTPGGVSILFDNQIIRAHIFVGALLTAVAIQTIKLAREPRKKAPRWGK